MRMLLWLGAMVAGMAMASPWAFEVVKLPPPQTMGGKPLRQAFAERCSSREFGAAPLQELSNLLWAANGVNRPESGKRTAPSARDWREIDVYVATADGVCACDPDRHALKRILDRDVRALTGMQEFVANAPVLVYIADFRRMPDAAHDDWERYAAVDAGAIAQNVYL